MLDLLSIVPYYTGHLCASLKPAGAVEVTLASITYHHDPEFFRRQGIHNDPGPFDLASRLRWVPAPARRLLKLSEYLINMAALLIRFSMTKPDVLHVQFLPLASYGLPLEKWLLRFARARGIKVVYTVHNVLPQDSRERHREMYRQIYQLADRLVCHDFRAASRLAREFAVEQKRISIIPHGPLFEGQTKTAPRQARARLGFGDDECVVLWQGIVRPYKGVSFLLKAWQEVCGANPRARLAVVGTGDSDLLHMVEEEVTALGIRSRVRLELRFVPVQELADFYQAADVLVYPYSEITTSGALMTGVVHGKAVVATALPAFEDMLRHDETALLVRYGDVDGLAATLLRLIGDSELRQALGTRLRESQAGFPRWDDIARRTCECYQAAVSEKPSYEGRGIREWSQNLR
jgi:glycosyltransferase involved in cell wall biosynthesis